jgi:hypothetical protein
MPETLASVLEDERRQAQILEDNGHENDAKLIRRVCDRVELVAAGYLNFVNEGLAMLRTGKTVRQLRRLYAKLEPRGQAKKIAGVRFYLEVMLDPVDRDVLAAREAGQKAVDQLREGQEGKPRQRR